MTKSRPHCSPFPPLQIAAGSRHIDIVHALLKYRAKPSARSKKDGSTPLHRACSVGEEDIVKLLLSYNADVNARDDLSNTPSMIAAQYDHGHIIAFLIKSKAKGSKLPFSRGPPTPLLPPPSSFYSIPPPEASTITPTTLHTQPKMVYDLDLLTGESDELSYDLKRVSRENAVVGAKVRSEWLQRQQILVAKNDDSDSPLNSDDDALVSVGNVDAANKDREDHDHYRNLSEDFRKEHEKCFSSAMDAIREAQGAWVQSPFLHMKQ